MPEKTPNTKLKDQLVSDILEAFAQDRIAEIISHKVSTGNPKVDAALDGGLPEGLTILGAEPRINTAKFYSRIIAHNITKRPVFVVSTAIGRNAIIPDVILELGEHDDDVIDLNCLKQLRIFDDLIDVDDIACELEDFIRETRETPLVIIDALQQLESASVTVVDESGKFNIDYALGVLNHLSLTHHLPILIVSWLSRYAYYKPITNASFKASDTIENIASVLLGLQVAGMSHFASGMDPESFAKSDPSDVEFIVIKNRYGKASQKVMLKLPPLKGVL